MDVSQASSSEVENSLDEETKKALAESLLEFMKPNEVERVLYAFSIAPSKYKSDVKELIETLELTPSQKIKLEKHLKETERIIELAKKELKTCKCIEKSQSQKDFNIYNQLPDIDELERTFAEMYDDRNDVKTDENIISQKNDTNSMENQPGDLGGQSRTQSANDRLRSTNPFDSMRRSKSENDSTYLEEPFESWSFEKPTLRLFNEKNSLKIFTEEITWGPELLKLPRKDQKSLRKDSPSVLQVRKAETKVVKLKTIPEVGCKCQSDVLVPLSKNDLLTKRVGCKILQPYIQTKGRKLIDLQELCDLNAPVDVFNKGSQQFAEEVRKKLHTIKHTIPAVAKRLEEIERTALETKEEERVRKVPAEILAFGKDPSSKEITRKILRKRINLLRRCEETWKKQEILENTVKPEIFEDKKEAKFAEICKTLTADKKFRRMLALRNKRLDKVTSRENIQYFLKFYPKTKLLEERTARFSLKDIEDQPIIINPVEPAQPSVSKPNKEEDLNEDNEDQIICGGDECQNGCADYFL